MKTYLQLGPWQNNIAMVGMMTVMDKANIPYEISHNKVFYDTDHLESFGNTYWELLYEQYKDTMSEHYLMTSLYPTIKYLSERRGTR